MDETGTPIHNADNRVPSEAELTRNMRPKTHMDNPPAIGAPENWPWGFLPCGCRNDGHGRHVR